MASKTRSKKGEARKKFALAVGEAAQFMPLLIDGRETSFLQLAKGVGSADQYHPKRSIQKYLDTLELMEFVRVVGDGVELLASGKRFRGSSRHAAAAVRNAFVTASTPKHVLQALSQTSTLTTKDVEARLRAIDRSSEASVWLEWLSFAGFIEVRGEDIIIKEFASDPRALYSTEESARLRELMYRRLAMVEARAPAGGGDCFHSPVSCLIAAFRSAKPDDAEAPMIRLVEAALFRLGFEVQVANGPRDSGDKLHFGTKGEDIIAFFLYPPAAASYEFNGLVVALELKRTSSDKKAVTQALAAKGRVASYFSDNVAVVAATISDSETYVDKVARDYANANNVLHIPIDALVALCDEQERRYKKMAANLITPVDIWHALSTYQNQNYTEPHSQDLLTEVVASADN